MTEKSDITVHMIVKNEEQWIWYAIASVINLVDEIFIYDTGSGDKTVEIIKTFHSAKIIFEKKGDVTASELISLRNEQLKKTKTLWFMLVDGDEVWTKIGITEFINEIKKARKEINGIVVKAEIPLGDLQHYQVENAGKYEILGKKGHYNIRGYRVKKNYRWQGIYPLEAYVDENRIPIQQKNSELTLLKNSYWHMTHMYRSRVDNAKRKFEIGKHKKYQLPEVFFINHPEIVPSPWISYSTLEKVKAVIRTPFVQIKRNL